MKIAILGYASQSQAAYNYWNKPGNQITICDSREDVAVPESIKTRLGADYLKGLDAYDLIIRGAPSIHPKEIIDANPDHPHILEKVTTVTNEFFQVCPTKNIIGITGTKGKGTTSTLVAHLLEAAGKRVHLGGNIGIPPLDMLNAGIKPTDWVVLELANFQLIDLKFSPHIAVCLMVSQEHLNWHADMEEYIASKQQIFAYQTVHDIAIYNRNNAHSEMVASISPAPKTTYEVPGPEAEPRLTTGAYLKGDTIYMGETPVCSVDDVALLGRHNLENVCAAIATTWDLIGHDAELAKKVIRDFKGLPHRLELVRSVNGVKYYNDSFASAPDAAMAAMYAIPGSKIMISGGFERGLELDGFVQVFAHHQADLRKILLIGESAQRLADALDMASFTNYEILTDVTMAQIVTRAKAVSKPGDSVILSPGFASFDMFKNFEDRGRQYQAAVKAL